MPKILFYVFNLPYLIQDNGKPVGGATVQIYSWLNGLKEINNKAAILTFKGASQLIGEQNIFDVVETYNKSEGLPLLKWITARIPSIISGIKKYKPDYLIRFGAGFESGLAAILGKILKIPVIIRIANDIDTDDRIKKTKSFFDRLMFSYSLKNSFLIVCQNNYQLEQLTKKYPEKKIIVLKNPFISKHDIPILQFNERKYIAWIGIFSRQKNLRLLYEIAKQNVQFEFRVAGKSLPTTVLEVEEDLELLKKLPNVKMAGFLTRKEIPDFLSKAFFLLNTSHYEGFSNTFLEALSAGTPIVTLKQNDPDSFIQNNKLGYIINEKGELNIQEILRSWEDKYDSLVKDCRDYLIKHHSPESLAQQLVSYLNQYSN